MGSDISGCHVAMGIKKNLIVIWHPWTNTMHPKTQGGRENSRELSEMQRSIIAHLNRAERSRL